jgi:aspartyl-tRNA(Asn)/glutamyl-tRNA(Gln) amidotransferase subunit C
MKKVSDELIDHLCDLAKLAFSEEEKERMKADFEKMLAFIEKINELPLEGVEPLIHIHEYRETPLREDEPITEITQAEALLNAPRKDSDYFRVPKFVRKEEL